MNNLNTDLAVRVNILDEDYMQDTVGVVSQGLGVLETRSTDDVYNLLSKAWALLTRGTKIISIFREALDTYEAASGSSVLSAMQIYDLEDIFGEIPLYNIPEEHDTKGILISLHKGFYYYELANKLFDDISICMVADSESVSAIYTYMELSISNIASGMSTLLWESIRFWRYREELLDVTNDIEVIKENYADMYGKVLKVASLLVRWAEQKSIAYTDFVAQVFKTSMVFTATCEKMIKYREDFEALKQVLTSTGSEEIYETYGEYILVQDIKCILDGTIEADEDYIARLEDRVNSYSPEYMELLSKLYDIAPTEYAFLYQYEMMLTPEDCKRCVSAQQLLPSVVSDIQLSASRSWYGTNLFK